MATVLVVEDDELVRDMITQLLRRERHDCSTAGGVKEARRAVSQQEFDLVICDCGLPDGAGIDVVRHIAEQLSDTAVLMLTGNDDPGNARMAFDLGAVAYMVKPFQPKEFIINVENSLRQRDVRRRQRADTKWLERTLAERSQALQSALQLLGSASDPTRLSEEETIRRLAKALTLRSEETGEHIRRVGAYASLLVTRMTPPVPWNPEGMFFAAMLHDVGKIGVPDVVLLKPGPLDDAERALICQHPELGHSLLADAQSPILLLGASIALTHHERWDGAGYPRGLAGTAIPLAGRVAAIADVFDALTSHRVYRPAMAFEQAAELMARERAQHFDPELLDLFLQDLTEAQKIRETHPDPVSAPG